MYKDDEKREPFKVQDGATLAYKPDTSEYVPVTDLRETWKRYSEEYPASKEQRQTFYQQRINLIESSEVYGDHRDELLLDLKDSALREESIDDSEDPPKPRPVPGGVGYGAYYKDNLLGFHESSVLYYNIVVIPDIGNAKNKWLYLTSTNRSPKGVEAYVAYHRQDNPTFNVFDWSKTGGARFALQRPFSLLGDYLIPFTANNQEYQTINVANSTRRIAGTKWRNEVMLYNPRTQHYDLIYSNDYDLAAADEQKYLWWGPIVETFPPFPFAINNVGFFDAQLLQDGTPPKLLTDAVTNIRIDHAGVQVVLRRPNHSFIVHWN